MKSTTLVAILVTVGIVVVSGTVPTEKIVHNAFEPEQGDPCRRATKKPCQKLQFTTCFGAKLPYVTTTNELVNENFTQHQLQNEMSRWEGLRNAPKCWAVIQPLLCSIYMPKCVDGFVDLPSQELCKVTRNPCRVIEQATKDWPDFLKCDDSQYPSNCKNNEIRELKFSAGKCMEPMVEVNTSLHNVEGFEGCSFKCHDPIFTDDEHESTYSLIKWFSLMTMASTAFVVVTYVLDWKSSRIYPSVIIFYVNICYFIATCGWAVQILPNTIEDIICRKDGTVRHGGPSKNESQFCTIVFLLIYTGTNMALAWLVVFGYVWYLTCNAVGRITDQIHKKRTYFWLFALIVPGVLTFLTVVLGLVDANSMSGICYVGYYDYTARIVFVLVPVGISCTLIIVFLGMGAWRLLNVSLSSSDFISARGRAEIKSNALRVVVFTLFAMAIVVTTLSLQVAEMQYRPSWETSFREDLLCKMNLTVVAECGILEKPSLTIIKANILTFFMGGLLISSWAWTSASIRIWKRCFRKCSSRSDYQQAPPVQKHKLISKAFAQRHELPIKGHLSLSLTSSRSDPVRINRMLDPTHLCHNMNEDSQQLNSNTNAHEEISNEWAAALPHLISRRGAIVPPHSSNSVSYMSDAGDSRRPSCESSMSEAAVRHLQGSGPVYDRSEYKKGRRRDWFRMARRSRSNRTWGWRRGHGGSSSSIDGDSNPGSQILPAITALIDKRLINKRPNNLHTPKRSTKEFAVQTSTEGLFAQDKPLKQCNLSNNLTCDKATQSSLVNLHEIGTQTKKSATKKKNKEAGKSEKSKEEKPVLLPADDPVLKLLMP